MPLLKVYGLNNDTNQNTLRSLMDELKDAVAGIEELGLTTGQVSVHFVPNLLTVGQNNQEIIVEVFGIFVKPERNVLVRKELATAVMKTTHNKFADTAKLVECFVCPFDEESGFASYVETVKT